MLKPLWEPSEQRIKDSNMYRFMQSVNKTHGIKFYRLQLHCISGR